MRFSCVAKAAHFLFFGGIVLSDKTYTATHEWLSMFSTGQRYAIWGCSDFAEQLVNSLKGDIRLEYIVDSDKSKAGSWFCGLPVYQPSHLLFDRGVKIIISNTYMGTRVKIANQLEEMGFTENVDFTYAELAMSIFHWSLHRRIVSQYVEISVTTYCTLNCKNCTAYMPYIKDRYYIPLQSLIESTRLYFSCVDYVGRFRVLGGEPLLYPHLSAYLEFVAEHYRDRIGELCIVTNGTVLLSDELLQVIKKHRITLFVSNYSSVGHSLTKPERYALLISVLQKEKIRYYFSEHQKWLALGNPNRISNGLQGVTLQEKFRDCRHYCRSIVGDRLFMCAAWAFAVLGNIYQGNENDFLGDEIIDMRRFSLMDKESKFNNWFRFDIQMELQNGFLDFCRYCNGFGSKNTNYIPIGEQMPR